MGAVADLITKPDPAENAIKAHDRMVISNKALAEALGFTEEDMPEPLEMAKPIEKTIAAQSEEYLSLKEREEKLARSKGPERGFDERRRLEIELMEELHRFNSRGTNSDSHPKVN